MASDTQKPSSSRSELLHLLASLIAIPSVYPEEQRISEFIEQRLRNLGIEVVRVPTGRDRFNLVARTGSTQPILGFYGHMDTVPPAADYAHNPFELRIDGDTARGLGVCDMKGGLSCMLLAAAFAAARNLPALFVFGVDEEDISRGAHDLVDSGKLSGLRLLVSAESGAVSNFDQDLSIVVGRKGRSVLRVEVRGRSAHAGEAEQGTNAIEQAAELIRALKQIPFDSHPRLGPTRLLVDGIEARAEGFSVPERCSIRISALTAPGTSSADCIEVVAAAARSVGAKVELTFEPRETPYGEAYEVDLENPWYRRLKEGALESVQATPSYAPSVADENVFVHRLGIPAVCIGPIGAGDHQSTEWVSISSLEKVVRVYERTLQTFSHD